MTVNPELPAELFQAVLDHPHDFSPRERCAEWLEAHGDPWGEYIHLALERARSPNRYLGVGGDHDREKRLEKLHGARWSTSIRPLAKDVAFSRGFVEFIRISAQDFLERAPRIFREAPVRLAQVENVPAAAPEFFASPFVQRLVALTLSYPAGDDEVSHLVTSASVRNLRYLSMGELTVASVEAIAASPNLSALEILHASCERTIKEDYYYDAYYQVILPGPMTPSPFADELEARYGYKAWLHPVERFQVPVELATPFWF